MTCLEALAQAGGASNRGAKRRASLVRPSENGQLIYHVDFKAIVEEADGTTNYELQEGDVIYVPPTAWAQVGYVMQKIFFPFQVIIGMGSRAVRL